MATKQMKKNELKFEDFEPVSELQELPEKFILIVNLPGKQGYLIHIYSKVMHFFQYGPQTLGIIRFIR